MKCYDCPRACGADRSRGEKGFCGGGNNALVCKTVERFSYEEPCLGSVTAVFFGGCSLKCSYCQNIKISRGGCGSEYSDTELAALFDGAGQPLDLVTPTHFLSAIERAVALCKRRPSIIYNTSGYETLSAVERTSAFTDVFLTDFKYGDAQTGRAYSAVSDYPTVAAAALKKMRDISDEYDNGILKRGLIVRHLVLPGAVDNSLRALDIIKDTVGTDVILSLMSQFTPNGCGEPRVRLKKIEYKLVLEHAVKLGFNNGYMQEFSSANSCFTPDFD